MLFDRIRKTLAGKRPWWDRPTLFAIPQLIDFRKELREKNLHDTEDEPLIGNLPPASTVPNVQTERTIDGTYNDLKFPRMGSVGARFGRNTPLDRVKPEDETLLKPSPREVSLRLMTRHTFQPATIVNLMAASWIQFQTHDWFAHSEDKDDSRLINIPLREDDPWPEHPMRVPRSEPDPNRSPASTKPPVFTNQVTHWWDGSQLYGSSPETNARVRTHSGGRLKVEASGKIPLNPDTGIEETGFIDNWWIGLSMLHGLFALEHNAICDALQRKFPDWTDNQLFHKARLINAALMAKIHTVEWTPAIVPNPTVQLGMRVNWRGLSGEGLQKVFPKLDDSELVGGIVGSTVDHHAAPYSLTEEFVSVYRMHPLLPDEFDFVTLAEGRPLGHHQLPDIAGRRTRAVLEPLAMADLFYSFGIAHPGAIRLHNYPRHLQNLTRDNGKIFDVAAVDVLRDRERGIPRYNAFREMLRLPRIATFEELTDNAQWAAEIKEVYEGDIDKVDTQVGLFAEPLPKGFGFSETAFRIFVLMASRRLKSDRFFTDDYRPEVYTQLGIDWIEKNGMASVLQRHFPELQPAMRGIDNPFAPWRNLHAK